MEHPTTIALVDDDFRVRESLENLLNSHGYNVCAFASAADMLQAWDTIAFDCILSDIVMPCMSGWQLTQIIQARSPGTPVILITALESAWKSGKFAKSGARRLLCKPFDGVELLNALNDVLRSFQKRNPSHDLGG
jgi:FixJ family two-component response regulator